MSRALALALVLLGGCSGSADLPPPPAPLAAPDLEGRHAEASPLVGRFRITAELTQTSRTGPPLRLTVEGVVTRDASGRSTLDEVKAVPGELSARIGDATAWPFDLLEAASRSESLSAWLRRVPSAPGCPGPSAPAAAVDLVVGPAGQGARASWSAATDRGGEVDHAADVAGTLELDSLGDATGGELKAQRWTRYVGCELVQQERLTVEALRPTAPR